MTTLSEPGNSTPATETPVEQILELFINELLDTPNAYPASAGGRPRYFWPEDDQIVVYVTGLPEDSAPIKAAIRAYAGYVGSDDRIRFPVKDIEIDRESGRIRVIGDPSRITEMRPLPKR